MLCTHPVHVIATVLALVHLCDQVNAHVGEVVARVTLEAPVARAERPVARAESAKFYDECVGAGHRVRACKSRVAG